MTNALLALKKLKKQNNSSVENIKTIIEVKMLPNIAIEVSTKLALKKHWNKLNPQQKLIFQQYISQSLVKDYGAILGSYDALENINITVHADVKHYDNKAIVKLIISFNEDDEPIIISLKMVQTTRWQIYDLVFSGVSIIKNYQAQFNSHIKRKGINSLIAKIIKKLG
ncbi:MAG: ABC transporter substrate-binding protein [Candidatus Thioglobus sp.]|nr:ABC transporter substrate-binding protein [Candidatus Thioglobus sp.]